MNSTMSYLVRRELWEHKVLYMAPLAVAVLILLVDTAVVIFGIRETVGFATAIDGLSTLDLNERSTVIATVLLATSGIFATVTTFVVFFYLLESLFTDRQDRSILFFKSLPVSDVQTVSSKLITGVLVTPGIMLAALFATHVALLIVFTVSAWIGGGSAWDLVWGPAPLVTTWIALVWATIAAAFWQAPIAAWLLLASAWAKGSRFIWAIGTPVAIVLLERTLFGTSQFFNAMAERFSGWWTHAFSFNGAGVSFDALTDEAEIRLSEAVPSNLLEYVDVGGYLAAPGLWGGLLVAAGLLAGAIYLRRYRELT